MKKPKWSENDEVYWTDPDNGISSGTYKIVKQITEDRDMSIWLITNGLSEAEVFQDELS